MRIGGDTGRWPRGKSETGMAAHHAGPRRATNMWAEGHRAHAPGSPYGEHGPVDNLTSDLQNSACKPLLFAAIQLTRWGHPRKLTQEVLRAGAWSTPAWTPAAGSGPGSPGGQHRQSQPWACCSWKRQQPLPGGWVLGNCQKLGLPPTHPPNITEHGVIHAFRQEREREREIRMTRRLGGEPPDTMQLVIHG